MGQRISLDVTFICADYSELLRSLIEQGLVLEDKPTKVAVHGIKLSEIPDDWPGVAIGSRTLKADFSDGSTVYVNDRDLVNIRRRTFDLDMARFMEQLSGAEFEMASIGTLHWWNNPAGPAYKAPEGSVAGPLGFAEAFRGSGHGRAMSRRWIERGPWRVLRGANDTTLAQFHAEDADMMTAIEQAKLGHQVMGDPAQAPLPKRSAYRSEVELKGTWNGPARELVVSVAGRRPDRKELREAVATRFYQLLGPDQPVDQVVYSFLDQKELDAVLPDLWLYGLEARLREASGWTRLDDKYAPPPIEKPDWVAKLLRDDRSS